MTGILQVYRVSVRSAALAGTGFMGILLVWPLLWGILSEEGVELLLYLFIFLLWGPVSGIGCALVYNLAARISGGIRLRVESPHTDWEDLLQKPTLSFRLEIRHIYLLPAFTTATLMVGLIGLSGAALLFLGGGIHVIEVGKIGKIFSFYLSVAGGLGAIFFALLYNLAAGVCGGIAVRVGQLYAAGKPKHESASQSLRFSIQAVALDRMFAINITALLILWLTLLLLVAFLLSAEPEMEVSLWGVLLLLAPLEFVIASLVFVYNRVARMGGDLKINGAFYRYPLKHEDLVDAAAPMEQYFHPGPPETPEEKR